jgi:hypothetical protein
MIDIIKHDIRLKVLKYIIPLSIILISFVLWIYNNNYPDATLSVRYITISIIVFSIWSIATVYSLFFMSTFYVKGNLIFKYKHILLFERKIKIEDVVSIKIIFRGVYGEPIFGFLISHGDRNEIEIKCKNGEIYLHTFLLKTNRDLSNLEKHMEYYKKNFKDIELYC